MQAQRIVITAKQDYDSALRPDGEEFNVALVHLTRLYLFSYLRHLFFLDFAIVTDARQHPHQPREASPDVEGDVCKLDGREDTGDKAKRDCDSLEYRVNIEKSLCQPS